MSVKERFRRFVRFIRKARIDSVQILLPIPLPGTDLRKRLETQHRVYPVQTVGWEYYDGNFPLFEPDAPMMAEGLQYAAKKIMTRVYQFHYVFAIIGGILTFPALAFSLYHLKRAWARWARKWRSHIIRFGGWITIQKWTSHFMKDPFLTKISKARKRLYDQHSNGQGVVMDRFP